jgi:hypothetical protein
MLVPEARARVQPARPIVVEKPVKKRGFIEYERGAAAYKVPNFLCLLALLAQQYKY